jgi:hypothetical protein
MEEQYIGDKIICPNCKCEYVHISSVEVVPDMVRVNMWCEENEHHFIVETYYRKGHTLTRII